MNILALGDPHGKLPKNLNSIIKKNKIELIICIGELYPIKRTKKQNGYADIKEGEKILEKICSYNLPIIIFKGNMFREGEWAKYFRNLIKRFKTKYRKLHYKKTGKIKIKGRDFVLFDMIYEKHSHFWIGKKAHDNKTNAKRGKHLDKLLRGNTSTILLSHAPPYGVLDKIYNGRHVGSKILLNSIKKHPPKLLLCGHIHEAKGETKIGRTKIYNLGSQGDYKILTI